MTDDQHEENINRIYQPVNFLFAFGSAHLEKSACHHGALLKFNFNARIKLICVIVAHLLCSFNTRMGRPNVLLLIFFNRVKRQSPKQSK